MLKPYRNERKGKNKQQTFSLAFGGDVGSSKRKEKVAKPFRPNETPRPAFNKLFKYFLYMGVALIISSDFIFNPLAGLLEGSQRALCSYFLGDLDTDSFWEQAFEVVASYLATDVTALPPGDVGFVITITHCPEEENDIAGYVAHEDPGAAFYDAAAALKYRIETTLNATGQYIASMHAIIHPDAIYCKGPDDLYYNRVRVLESLGYYVKIKGSFLILPDGSLANISDPYVAANLYNDGGDRSLIDLNIYDIDNMDLLVGVSLDTALPETINTPNPTASPTSSPTGSPTKAPTANPTGAPTGTPTAAPTFQNSPLDNTLDAFASGTLEAAFSPVPTPPQTEQIIITQAPTPTPPPTPTSPPTPTPPPTEQPTTASPTAPPVTSAPTTSAPSKAPVTDAPTTASPTSAPTTASPTAGPTTASPTAAPVTNAPITPSPTAAPVTNAPTTEPTTSSPTLAPTTDSPTVYVPPTPVPANLVNADIPAGTIEPLTADIADKIFYNGSGTIDMSTFYMVKPNDTMMDTLRDVYLNTPFDFEKGWNSTGFGVHGGVLSSSGLLAYYYGALENDKAGILNSCEFGTAITEDCESGTILQQVGNMKVCGSPWSCPDLSNLTDVQRSRCETLLNSWYESRIAFEDECFIGAPGSEKNGTFNQAVAHGLCETTGKAGYEPLVKDSECGGVKSTEWIDRNFTNYRGDSQVLRLMTTVGETTRLTRTCVEAVLQVKNIGYNIALVFDTSASSNNECSGRLPKEDHNNDGNANTILDAEIDAALELLDSICGTYDLGNENVTIGVISFDGTATYHNKFSPCEEQSPLYTNPELVTALVNLQVGGNTSNYTSALETTALFFDDSLPIGRINNVYFLSDGKPTVPGLFEANQTATWKNPIIASNYTSSLEQLDAQYTHRFSVGFCEGADVRKDFDLGIIDNTDEGPYTDLDTLIGGLPLHNPNIGKIADFETLVNDNVHENVEEEVENTPTGLVYTGVVNGLDPIVDHENEITVRVTLSRDDAPEPTPSPTPSPTETPTVEPTLAPIIPIKETTSPSAAPTEQPTSAPTNAPTMAPTAAPTELPTPEPTGPPTAFPTDPPTKSPSDPPTTAPTAAPTASPTDQPTKAPTESPTKSPTDPPSRQPTPPPTNAPTDPPTNSPTDLPTLYPTNPPTDPPTYSPTSFDSQCPVQPLCESNLGAKLSGGTGSGVPEPYPKIHEADNPKGYDNSASVLVAGNFLVTKGAEIEGKFVTLGDFTIAGSSNFHSFGRAGVGSQVVPSSGQDVALIGGDMKIDVPGITFMYPGYGNIIHKGSNIGLYNPRQDHPQDQIIADPNLDLSEWNDAFCDLKDKSTHWATLPQNGVANLQNGNTWVFSAGDSDCLQVFNFGIGTLVKSWGIHLKWDSSLEGKTILINVAANQNGIARVKNFADFFDHNGKGGFNFSPDLTSRILWNFHDAKRVILGCDTAANGEFQGTILVPTPSASVKFCHPGHSGRIIVNGDLEQHGSGSEFHNYAFDPPCPLPLPPSQAASCTTDSPTVAPTDPPPNNYCDYDVNDCMEVVVSPDDTCTGSTVTYCMQHKTSKPAHCPSKTYDELVPSLLADCVQDNTNLVIYNSILTENNLDGQGPLAGGSAIRYSGVGEYNGDALDLVVTVVAGNYLRKSGNGLNCPGQASECLSEGHFGTINMMAGHDATLRFKLVKSGTNTGVVLPGFYFSLFDIDESTKVRETYTIRGWTTANYDQTNSEASFQMCDVGSPSTCLVAQSTTIGKGCDNPEDPATLGVITCLDNTVDQLKRSVTFGFENQSEFDIEFTTPCIGSCPDSGRNFLFSFESEWVNSCPSPSPADSHVNVYVDGVDITSDSSVQVSSTCSAMTECKAGTPNKGCSLTDLDTTVGWKCDIDKSPVCVTLPIDELGNHAQVVFSVKDRETCAVLDPTYDGPWTCSSEENESCGCGGDSCIFSGITSCTVAPGVAKTSVDSDVTGYCCYGPQGTADGAICNGDPQPGTGWCDRSKSNCEDGCGGLFCAHHDTPAPTPSYFCGCETCTPEVFNSIASDDSGSFTCKARVEWLQSHGYPDEGGACKKVAQEFPNGPCGPACNPEVCGTPTESPTTCVPDECGVCNGPGKYLCCDGSEVCDPATCPQSKPVSVCFAMDESGSVCSLNGPNGCSSLSSKAGQSDNNCDYLNNCPKFNVHTKDFAKTLIDGLDAVTEAKFAAVSFGRYSHLDSPLVPGVVAKNAIDNIQFSGGWTNTQAAINSCRMELANAPDDHLKYLVIITDGYPTNNRRNSPYSPCQECQDEAEEEANFAKGWGQTVISVGVESVSTDTGNVKSLASSEDLFIPVNDYALLQEKINEINQAANICTGPEPAPIPATPAPVPDNLCVYPPNIDYDEDEDGLDGCRYDTAKLEIGDHISTDCDPKYTLYTHSNHPDKSTWTKTPPGTKMCGKNAHDARARCGKECNHSGDCPGGQWCWIVEQSYCGSKPDPSPTCTNLKAKPRCGTSIFEATEMCGRECHNDNDCNTDGGERCFQPHMNYCHCLGDSYYNEMLCNYKQVEFVSRVVENGDTTFTWRITDTDPDYQHVPKSVTIGWEGTCCAKDVDWFFHNMNKVKGKTDKYTCNTGLMFDKKWNQSQTQPELFSITMHGDVPLVDNASTISIPMQSHKFCLYQTPGPSCDCEASEIVFSNSQTVTGNLL